MRKPEPDLLRRLAALEHEVDLITASLASLSHVLLTFVRNYRPQKADAAPSS